MNFWSVASLISVISEEEIIVNALYIIIISSSLIIIIIIIVIIILKGWDLQKLPGVDLSLCIWGRQERGPKNEDK